MFFGVVHAVIWNFLDALLLVALRTLFRFFFVPRLVESLRTPVTMLRLINRVLCRAIVSDHIGVDVGAIKVISSDIVRVFLVSRLMSCLPVQGFQFQHLLLILN